MKYLLLAYGDENWWNALSTSERNAFEDARRANDEALRQSGHLLAAESFQDSSVATTICVHDGELTITDSPLIESEQSLIGLYFIDARDLNHAIYVASQMPQAQVGLIKIRPMTEFDQ